MNHKRMMDARLRRDLNERKSLLRNLNDREKLTLKEKRSSGSRHNRVIRLLCALFGFLFMVFFVILQVIFCKVILYRCL